MKIFLILTIYFAFSCMEVQAKESTTPRFSERFGEVVDLTIEFVKKPNDYFSENIVKAKWFAKVTDVNGKRLKEPIIIEYRWEEDKFKEGEILTVRAYEDLESSGINRGWDGNNWRQLPYAIVQFIRIRIPKSFNGG